MQVQLPKALGLPDELEARPVVMEVVYGPADGEHCATAAVSFPEWPYSNRRGEPIYLDAAVAFTQPLVEALCVELGP